MLTKDEVVDKVTCKKGHELGVDKQKRLVFCTIAKAVDVDGLAVKADSYTLFHPNGRIYQTHVRAKFDAQLGDKTKVTCGPDAISVFDDGTLAYCRLAGPRAGSPRARVGEGISFHRGGRISGMTLDETYKVAGLELPAGSSFHWDDKGVPIAGRVATPITAGALMIRYELSLHPNGKLRSVELAAKVTIQGHAFPERAELLFRADGTLEAAKYIEDDGFMPHGEQWTETRYTTYDAKGKVTSTRLDRWQSNIPERKFNSLHRD